MIMREVEGANTVAVIGEPIEQAFPSILVIHRSASSDHQTNPANSRDSGVPIPIPKNRSTSSAVNLTVPTLGYEIRRSICSYSTAAAEIWSGPERS